MPPTPGYVLRDIRDATIAIQNARADWMHARHKAVLCAMATYFHTPSPTCETLAQDTSLSRSTVAKTIRELREHGVIDYDPGKGVRNEYTVKIGVIAQLAKK